MAQIKSLLGEQWYGLIRKIILVTVTGGCEGREIAVADRQETLGMSLFFLMFILFIF